MIEIYCDGSRVKTNPGPGGWAVVIYAPDGEKVLTGGASQTTAPRMELEAVVAAAEAVPADMSAVIFCDHRNAVKGIKEWVDGWIQNGWRRSGNKPVAHSDLWRRLVAARDARPRLSFKRVPAHSGQAGRGGRRDGAASPRP